MVWKIPAFTTSFLAACASRSMVLWLEFIENASIFIPGIILLILSRKLNKNLKFRYNYGTEKVEAITALSCEMFDLAGLFCIVLFAVRNLIKGSEEGEYVLGSMNEKIHHTTVGLYMQYLYTRKDGIESVLKEFTKKR